MGVKRVSFMVLLVAFCVLGFAESESHNNGDCSSLVLDMVDCLPFVQNGSTSANPTKACCNGLRSVLKANASCLCVAFKNSAQFGVVLNLTKAMELPAACKVSAPPVSDCGLSPSPAPAPVPARSPSPSPSGGAAPSREPAGAMTAPAPAPKSSGLSSMNVSVGFLAICIGVVAFFSF